MQLHGERCWQTLATALARFHILLKEQGDVGPACRAITDQAAFERDRPDHHIDRLQSDETNFSSHFRPRELERYTVRHDACSSFTFLSS